MKRNFLIFSLIIFLAALAPFFLIAWQIYTFAGEASDVSPADAAIVLGAAVWTDHPSPVFRERINYAVNLYKTNKIRKIIFTGGQGNSDERTEARIGQFYAVEKGVKKEDILIENKSGSTLENLEFSKPIADSHDLKKVLIVSDPLHMKRAMAMAEFVGFDAAPAPTPTSVYQGFTVKARQLFQETYHYTLFLARDFVKPV